MKDNLNLYKYLVDFARYMNEYVTGTIPSVHRDMRIHLLDEMYYLRKNLLYSINTKEDVRLKYLIDTKINLIMIDMTLSDIRDINCCKTSRLDEAVDKLTNIKNIIYEWISSGES